MSKKIDAVTLKALVIDMKDSGMSFQEISDKLKEDYGFSRTRQALSGLYSRAKKANAPENTVIECDIVNVYCLCNNASQTYEKLTEIGVEITYRQVLNTIKNKEKYIESVRQTIIANIESKINTIDDIRLLMASIDYKGIAISKKQFDIYFKEACKHNISTEIYKKLATIYKLSLNKEILRDLGKEFGLNVVTTDIKSYVDDVTNSNCRDISSGIIEENESIHLDSDIEVTTTDLYEV